MATWAVPPRLHGFLTFMLQFTLLLLLLGGCSRCGNQMRYDIVAY